MKIQFLLLLLLFFLINLINNKTRESNFVGIYVS